MTGKWEFIGSSVRLVPTNALRVIDDYGRKAEYRVQI